MRPEAAAHVFREAVRLGRLKPSVAGCPLPHLTDLALFTGVESPYPGGVSDPNQAVIDVLVPPGGQIYGHDGTQM